MRKGKRLCSMWEAMGQLLEVDSDERVAVSVFATTFLSRSAGRLHLSTTYETL